MEVILKLTGREKSVYNLSLEYFTTKEACKILKMKEGTFKFHKNNIYRKLGFSNAIELINSNDFYSTEKMNKYNNSDMILALCVGKNISEVSKQFGIKKSTVKFHIAKIFKETGVPCRLLLRAFFSDNLFAKTALLANALSKENITTERRPDNKLLLLNNSYQSGAVEQVVDEFIKKNGIKLRVVNKKLAIIYAA